MRILVREIQVVFQKEFLPLKSPCHLTEAEVALYLMCCTFACLCCFKYLIRTSGLRIHVSSQNTLAHALGPEQDGLSPTGRCWKWSSHQQVTFSLWTTSSHRLSWALWGTGFLKGLASERSPWILSAHMTPTHTTFARVHWKPQLAISRVFFLKARVLNTLRADYW